MMKLTDGEKLILTMLCELYEKLGIKGEIDSRFVKEAIVSGNLWGLKWNYGGLFHDYEASEDVLHETVDILDMWTFLESGYEKLTPEEKFRVEEEAAPLGKYVHFTGFDGNGEPEYNCVARFLIEQLDRFQNFKGRELNSHMPTLEACKRMLAVFGPLRSSLGNGQLTTEKIIDILKARIHPDNRREKAAASGKQN
jgi:uncharacterized protein